MKTLKTLSLLFALMLFATGYAQKSKHEQVKALKVSFLTTELNLSSDEAGKFWAIYNEYDEKQYRIRHDIMGPIIKKIGKAGEKISEKEAASYLDRLEAADKDLANLKAKLVSDLKPVIGSAKILKLKKAEEDFKRKLLEQFKDKKQ